MALTARINLRDHFDHVTQAVDRKTIAALNAGAKAGAAKANDQLQMPDHAFKVIPAHGTGTGFASAIKAADPLWRIFNKGSLGRRAGPLKGRNRRKAHVSHRDPEALTDSSKGVGSRDVANPARAAGRKAIRLTLGR